MTLTNTSTQYGSIAKYLHWSIAFLIIGMLILGNFMGDFEAPLKGILYAVHKSTGMTILFLVILRILWRLFNKPPALPSMPQWEKFTAHFSHIILYAAILAMPLSGWIMSTAGNHDTIIWWALKFNTPGIPHDKALSELSNNIHEILGWTTVAVVSIHILAALKHHFIDKNDILKRMS